MTEKDNKLLFIDLDGVLVDFEKGVENLFSKKPDELAPRTLWPRLARTPDFYTFLDWMPDGKVLWEFCQSVRPVILTGLPIGKWAEPQKRAWCERELGSDVEVITCLSRHKAKRAQERADGMVPVLVDDREKLRAPFEESGGIFVHHVCAEQTIEQLGRLGF